MLPSPRSGNFVKMVVATEALMYQSPVQVACMRCVATWEIQSSDTSAHRVTFCIVPL